jgi:hypothetical protein
MVLGGDVMERIVRCDLLVGGVGLQGDLQDCQRGADKTA